jgi:hypothetical protein
MKLICDYKQQNNNNNNNNSNRLNEILALTELFENRNPGPSTQRIFIISLAKEAAVVYN